MRRLLFLIILLVILAIALAAVTLTNNNVDRVGFVVNANSADLSGCETLKAAVTGKSIYIERIYIISGTAINYTLGAGETASAVTTVIVGPIYCAADSNTPLVFTRAIKLAAATALTADASGAGAVTIIVQGYIK